MRRPLTVGGALRLILLLILVVIALYPVVWIIGSSLNSTAGTGAISFWPKHFTVRNFTAGWSGLPSVTFGRFFLNSTLISLAVVVANTASCLVTAYAFARLRFPLRRFWFAIMIGTLLMPSHVLVIPQYILFRHLGWVNTPLPLIVPKLLATESVFVFLMVQFMRTVPRNLDESAKIDGCSPYRVFSQVILPLSRPALAATAIFSFIWTWNDFFTQLIYLSDVDRYTVPVGLRLFLDSAGENAIGPLFAMSVLSLLPVLVFFVAFQRMLLTGVSTGRVPL